jgi:hypothetical protein
MAIVQVKDVTVTYVNKVGTGVKVTEQNESRGKVYKQSYTVWFDKAHNLAVGDVVSLSGFLSAKISEPWTDRDGNQRTSVELSINSPRLVPPVTPAQDSWAKEEGNVPF